MFKLFKVLRRLDKLDEAVKELDITVRLLHSTRSALEVRIEERLKALRVLGGLKNGGIRAWLRPYPSSHEYIDLLAAELIKKYKDIGED